MRLLTIGMLLTVILCPAARGTQEVHRHPLAPADTSSPRATFRTFLVATDEVYRLIQERGRKVRGSGQGSAMVEVIFECMDLGDIAPSIRLYSGGEAARSNKSSRRDSRSESWTMQAMMRSTLSLPPVTVFAPAFYGGGRYPTRRGIPAKMAE